MRYIFILLSQLVKSITKCQKTKIIFFSATNRPTNLQQPTGPISSTSDKDLSSPSGLGNFSTQTSIVSKVVNNLCF